MKRIAVIMFSATLILCSVFLITVFSADGDSLTYGSFTYQVTDGEVTITKLDPGVSGTVIIPSSIEGKSVVALSNAAFSGCSLVTSLRIPSSVKTIGNGALSGLTNIERIDYQGTIAQWCGVELGNTGSVPFSITDSVYINGRIITEIGADDWQGLTSISNNAFYGCSTLVSVVLPDTLTSIGQFSFFKCDNLTSLAVAPGNAKYHSSGNCLIETESKTLIKGIRNSVIPDDGSVTAIASAAFRGCSGLTRIVIPEGVTAIKPGSSLYLTGSLYIANGAFSNCLDLEEVVLPGTIETIGDGAFSDCENLKTITLPNGTKTIGGSAFRNCTSLTEINIPETVEKIERRTFYGCTSLETMRYDAVNADLEAKTLQVTTPSSPYRVDWLYNCPALKTLVIGKNVETIPDYAFYNINTIDTISLWNGVQTIGEFSFEFCDSFSKVYFSGTPEEWLANYNRYFKSNSYIHDIYYIGGICCKSDELSNISVEFEYGTFGTPNDSELSLDVDSISANDPRFSAFKVNVDGEQYALYSIHMTDADNNDKQPVNDSKVTVKIPLPFNISASSYDTVFIHHRKYDGTTERIKYKSGDLTIEDGFFIFEIDSFSDFAVCADDEGNHIDENGDYFCDLCGESLTYSVKLIVDGVNLGDIIYHYGDTEIDNLPGVPEKPGYTGEWDYTITGSELEIRPAYTPVTYYATFVVDGVQLGERIPFTVENLSVNPPAVPAKDGYIGKWSEYTLALCDITIQAIYEKMPDNPDNPDIPGSSVNPTASAKIKVKSDSVYKNSKVIVTAKAEGVPKGYYLAVFDGKTEVERGTNSSVTYEIKELVSRDKKLTVKVIDKDGNVQKNAKGEKLTDTINITVKTGFFDVIIAFFKKLFGSNKAYISA